MDTSTKTRRISIEHSQDALTFRNPIQRNWAEIYISSLYLIIWSVVSYQGIAFLLGPKQVSQRPTEITEAIANSTGLWKIYPIIFFFFLVWLIFGASKLHLILWQLFGAETIQASNHSINVSRQIFNHKKEITYSINKIQNFRISTRSIYSPKRLARIIRGTISFDYDKKTRSYLGYDISKKHARKILRMIFEKFPEYKNLKNKTAEKQRKKAELITGLLLLSPAILLFIFFFYQFLIWGPIAKNMKEPLQAEYELITPLPGAQAEKYRIHSEPTNATISTKYQSTANSPEIFTHYDNELTEQGWRFFKENRNYDDTERIYCKDEYAISIRSYETKYYGYKYSLWVNWGSNGIVRCPIVKGSLSQLEPTLNWLFPLAASIAWIIFGIITKHSNSKISHFIIISIGLYGLSLSLYGIFKLLFL
jgi:hypothetical protein